ncbi:ribosomal-protein-alanine acetyltransferase [Leifsonia xyli subsp. xyli]|uniref:Ribosomal-protein-alanine acetyltransferase n=1 Tax=Leifsonia xyli subsp. xyli TaxID=59736 RepID=A0A1E2SN87_LEIXY|nr:ribosomal protein S18-alanine N-acetyltransferase [Leifsonia xyli]ODA91191.1 ribosomal-protein-alanine acetyltransferase [Leifsonia xyli subsp. xyli]
MTWQLRRAGAEDVPAIMEVERGIFVSDAWSEYTMLAEVTGEHRHYLVAFPPGEPARIDAYAGLLAPRGSGEGDIQTVAVAPHARRRGLGRTLLLALVGEARKRGAREVFLKVRADNPGARSLYRQLGFEEMGVCPQYYQPDGVDAIVMRLTVPSTETTPA